MRDAPTLGVTAPDGNEPAPTPASLVAETTNVYAVPFDNPDTNTTVTGGEPETVVVACATAPTNGVTVNDVIALPLSKGATQLTTAAPSAAQAETPNGASGTANAAAVPDANGEPNHPAATTTDTTTPVTRNRRPHPRNTPSPVTSALTKPSTRRREPLVPNDRNSGPKQPHQYFTLRG